MGGTQRGQLVVFIVQSGVQAWWSIGWSVHSVVGGHPFFAQVHIAVFSSWRAHVNAHHEEEVCQAVESNHPDQVGAHNDKAMVGGGGGGGGGNRHRGRGGARAQTINQVRTTS